MWLAELIQGAILIVNAGSLHVNKIINMQKVVTFKPKTMHEMCDVQIVSPKDVEV